MSTTTTALWRQPVAERWAAAERYTGRLAAVYYSGLRDPEDLSRIVGEVLAVAAIASGGGSDIIVVREVTGGRAYAISLATVYAIRLAPEEPGEEAAC